MSSILYIEFVTVFVGKLVSDASTDALVNVIQFELVGWCDEFVPLRKSLLFDYVDEGVLKFVSVGQRGLCEELLEDKKIEFGPDVVGHILFLDGRGQTIDELIVVCCLFEDVCQVSD